VQVRTDQNVAERITEDGDDLLDLTTIGLVEAVRQI
jgi:DNA-directed RNA polymerase specialized sigma subunit